MMGWETAEQPGFNLVQGCLQWQAGIGPCAVWHLATFGLVARPTEIHVFSASRWARGVGRFCTFLLFELILDAAQHITVKFVCRRLGPLQVVCGTM